MTDWSRVPFSDLLIESKDGEWGNGEATPGHELVNVVRGTDFKVINSPSASFPQRWVADSQIRRKALVPGDLLLETAGGTASQSTGRSALLKQSFFDRHGDRPVLCASFSRFLRLDKSRFEPAFVYYLFQWMYDGGYMAVYNIQHTGVSRFQYTSFKKSTTLVIPNLSLQRKIAAILTAYDDLIENNKRRIALLEKMAEEIYREWFVRLRFPGHASTRTNKSMPEGWQRISLMDLCRLKRGYDLPHHSMEVGTHPVIGATGVSGAHSKFKVQPPVVTTGRSGSLGTVVWSDEPSWPLNTTLYVRDFFGNSPYFVFHTLTNAQLGQFNAGAGVPTLNRNHLSSVKLLKPPATIQSEFDRVLEPIAKQAATLRHASVNLQKTRDLLRGRLISGKLRVDQLDIQFPPSMREST